MTVDELKIIISAETEKFKKACDEVKEQLSQIPKSSKDVSEKTQKHIKEMGEGVKSTLKKATVTVTAMATAFLALGETTKEYRQQQAQLTATFKASGSSAEQAKKTYSELFATLGDSDRAVEASSNLASLKLGQEELAEWTNICTGAFATYGDALPIEGLTEASNETAKVGKVTGVLADALNWAGVSEDDFNDKLAQCNSESEREALIRGTLNGLYSKASETYKENNAQLMSANDAQRRLSEALANVGAVAEPLMTFLKETGATVLESMTPFIQDFAENTLPKIKTWLEPIEEVIEKTINFVIDNWGTIKTILTVVATLVGIVTTAIMLYNVNMAIKNAMDMANVTTLGGLISAQLACASATMVALAPFIAIVAAIVAVIAIIVVCIKHWDEIKETVTNVCNAISSKVSEWMQSLKNTFSKIKDAITKPFNEAKDTVKGVIDKIRGFFDFQWSLPKLKMPHVKISGEFSLVPPKVPKFSIDWYAKGGVIDTPTLFNYGNGRIGGLGEAGAEAIVPLENNTEWLDKIADRLGNNAPTEVYLQVDGKTLAKTTIKNINSLTKQTGKLGLTLG